MKLKHMLFTLALLAFIPTGLLAQKMSKHSYHNMVDYVNCEITSYYLSILHDSSDVKAYLLIKDELKKNTLNNPVSFTNLKSLLLKNNQFTNTQAAISAILDSNKDQYDLATHNNELVNSATNINNLNEANKKVIQGRMDELRSKLNVTFSKSNVQLESIENRLFSQTCLLTLLFFGLLLLAFMFYKNKLKLDQLLLCEQNINPDVTQTQQPTDIDLNPLYNQIKQMQSDIEQMRNQVQKISLMASSVPSQTQQVPTFQAQSNVPEVEPTDEINIIDITTTPEESNENTNQTNTNPIATKAAEDIYFYMSTPSLDGSFHMVGSSTQFKPSITLYKFKIDPNNPNLAEFSFYSDESGIAASTGFPQTYLDPACKASHIFNSAQTIAIETIIPGTAERRGDTWFVITKAKIAYIKET